MSEPVARESVGEDLVVDSVTGVDVALPVAGPGARAFAFVVDYHIRLIIAIAVYVIGALLYNGRWSLTAPANPDSTWVLSVMIPTAVVYFLYHPILEVVMHGRTPGKRMAGIRIVTRDGAMPTIGALLTRNIFRLLDSFPFFYATGLIATMVTRNHVRVGDMAAGTLLVYDHSRTALLETPATVAQLDSTTAELIHELLQRWSSLDFYIRQSMARTVLTRVASLGVPVGNLQTATDFDLHRELQRLTRGDRL